MATSYVNAQSCFSASNSWDEILTWPYSSTNFRTYSMTHTWPNSSTNFRPTRSSTNPRTHFRTYTWPNSSTNSRQNPHLAQLQHQLQANCSMHPRIHSRIHSRTYTWTNSSTNSSTNSRQDAHLALSSDGCQSEDGRPTNGVPDNESASGQMTPDHLNTLAMG